MKERARERVRLGEDGRLGSSRDFWCVSFSIARASHLSGGGTS